MVHFWYCFVGVGKLNVRVCLEKKACCEAIIFCFKEKEIKPVRMRLGVLPFPSPIGAHWWLIWGTQHRPLVVLPGIPAFPLQQELFLIHSGPKRQVPLKKRAQPLLPPTWSVQCSQVYSPPHPPHFTRGVSEAELQGDVTKKMEDSGNGRRLGDTHLGCC